jgi:hypothetical protein
MTQQIVAAMLEKHGLRIVYLMETTYFRLPVATVPHWEAVIDTDELSGARLVSWDSVSACAVRGIEEPTWDEVGSRFVVRAVSLPA